MAGGKRSLLLASLPHGPRNPVTALPPRRPGSVRRTTTIDQRRTEPGGPMSVVASGRDLRTAADGTTTVLDEVVVRAELDAAGTITELSAEPPEPGLEQLVGAHSSRGFRGKVDAALPAHRDRATVLHQLLDDFPMAALISNYGSSREQEDFELPPESAERLADLCAGWAREATMMGALEASGIFPIPIGPPAPDLVDADDPLAWHELEPMATRSVRRRRRLDLEVGPDGSLHVDVHFRDSHLGAGDEPEDVLHEYTLDGTVDAETLVVLTSEATARTLPWPECPGAVVSAPRVVGERVTDLRPLVHADFTGTTTCTHLNDVLRSLAGVANLAGHL